MKPNLIILLGFAFTWWSIAADVLFNVNDRFKYDEAAAKVHTKSATYRMHKLLQTFYVDSGKKIEAQNGIRFTYEESPHYEQGYMMHEIIERYKKMVEHMRMLMYPTRTVTGCMDFVAHMQHIYIEMYHLVNMFHEIPRKWKYRDEFNEDYIKPDPYEEFKRIKALKDAAKAIERLERDRRKKLRALQKAREKFGNFSLSPRIPGSKKEPYNELWPIDYGWELSKEHFKALNG